MLISKPSLLNPDLFDAVVSLFETVCEEYVLHPVPLQLLHHPLNSGCYMCLSLYLKCLAKATYCQKSTTSTILSTACRSNI